MRSRHASLGNWTKLVVILLVTVSTAYAQSDPWSNIAGKLSGLFSGPLVRGFAVVCVVIGGLEVAFGEGHSKRIIGGIVFGLGMALGAVSFLSLFN